MPESLSIARDGLTFTVPMDRLFTSDGLWLKSNGCLLKVGLSDHITQTSDGFTKLAATDPGFIIPRGRTFLTLTSPSGETEFASPIRGKIRTLNTVNLLQPEIFLQAPYSDEAWICEMEAFDWDTDKADLLSPVDYFRQLKGDVD